MGFFFTDLCPKGIIMYLCTLKEIVKYLDAGTHGEKDKFCDFFLAIIVKHRTITESQNS